MDPKAPLPELQIRKGEVLVLRTCDKDLKAHGGFQWPSSGPVKAPDFSKEAKCGEGLHGLLWGEGNSSLLCWEEDAKGLIIAVLEKEIIKIDSEKVKFPRGRVLFVGTLQDAGALLSHYAPPGTLGVCGTATAGVCGTATAGYRGTATAGYRGTATAGDSGTATAGDSGTATAGDSGAATAGVCGTATAGDSGVLVVRYWAGDRFRLVVGYVGENGIKANTKYKLDENHQFVAVK